MTYKQAPSMAVYKDHMGDDNSVVNADRVSFAKDASNFTPEQNKNLIKYLAKHNHWTPFAHVFVLDIASRGNMPIPLRYASAHTGRYGGCFVAETIVCLKSKNPFDPSPYYANIIDATSDTLIWNGEEFVEHDGVICNGVQEVINYDGLCGTRGHKVFTESGIVSLEYARNNMISIIDCPLPSSTTIYPIQGTRPMMTYADEAVVPVYDIINAGKDYKYMANGKLVHNSDKVNP